MDVLISLEHMHYYTLYTEFKKKTVQITRLIFISNKNY